MDCAGLIVMGAEGVHASKRRQGGRGFPPFAGAAGAINSEDLSMTRRKKTDKSVSPVVATVEPPCVEAKALEAWASALVARHAEQELSLEFLTEQAASSAPYAQLSFVRAAAMRARIMRRMPHVRPGRFSPRTFGHPTLLVRVHASGIELDLDLPTHAAMDREGLRRQLQQPQALLGALRALPEVVRAPWHAMGPGHGVTVADLSDWLSTPDAHVLLSAWLPRASLQGSLLVADAAADSILAVYRALTHGTEADLRRLRPASKTQGKPKRNGPRSRRHPGIEDDEPMSVRGPELPVELPEPRSAPPSLLSRLKSVAPRVVDMDPKAKIVAGAQVYVLDGAFSGKVGVVQDLMVRGMARVAFGRLMAQLALRDLCVCRPRAQGQKLTSSHRRVAPR